MFALTARYSMSEIRIPSTLENRFNIRLQVRTDSGMPPNRSAGRSPELTTLPAWSTRNLKSHFGQIPQHCTELNSVPQSGHCRDHLSLTSTMWAPQLGNVWHHQVAERCVPSVKAPTATLMHTIVLAFVSGTALHYGHHFYRHIFYTGKRLISSVTDVLSFTPTVSPFYMNRESHENRESLCDANRPPLPQITTLKTLIASSKETLLEIRDRAAEKGWAKKGRLADSRLYFSAHPFFATSNALPKSPSTSKMPFNVNAFQGDQNIVEYWIPDTRTCHSSGRGSDNNSGMPLPSSFPMIISTFQAMSRELLSESLPGNNLLLAEPAIATALL
jgi:hypothetical protein